jgi:hypothetical protein
LKLKYFLFYSFLTFCNCEAKWVGALKTEKAVLKFEPVEYDADTMVLHQVDSDIKIVKTINNKSEIITNESQRIGFYANNGYLILIVTRESEDKIKVKVNMVSIQKGESKNLKYKTVAHFVDGSCSKFVSGQQVKIALTEEGAQTTAFALREYFYALLQNEAKKAARLFSPKVEITDFILKSVEISSTISQLIQNMRNAVKFMIRL